MKKVIIIFSFLSCLNVYCASNEPKIKQLKVSTEVEFVRTKEFQSDFEHWFKKSLEHGLTNAEILNTIEATKEHFIDDQAIPGVSVQAMVVVMLNKIIIDHQIIKQDSQKWKEFAEKFFCELSFDIYQAFLENY